MSEVTIIGIDLAKRVFQLHGARDDGSVVFRKKLSRGQVLVFFAQQPNCVVAMEACATAHGWGRELERLGHSVRLIPPVYVKPFVKRQKNDAADAEAIVEAALRPTMRFVAVKTEDQQARAMLFRTRQMFVGQRTQLINALRGHLAEHGLVAATGTAQLKRLADAIEDSNTALPEGVRDLGQMYLTQIEGLNARVAELDLKMRSAAKEADVARRFWADANTDFVGIDNYMPLSDWRDGDQHLDAQAGWPAIYDLPYLQSNIEGGEGFDWFYASDADRSAQTRTPVTDGAFGKPWVFRPKDVRSWWLNQHFNRPDGVQSGSPTAWVPQSKPVRFTEAGAPAVDRGTNQPNVFYDPKSSESFLPYFSRGYQDDLVQRRYIEALYPYWNDPARNPASNVYSGRMIDTAEIAIWTWDARPYPAFPVRSDVWSDIDNYRLGHWLTGRIGGCGLAELVRELCLTGGVPLDLIDVSQLAATVPGYAIAAIESARASIAPLAQFYGFDVVETGGQLRFVPRGRPAVAQIAADTLVITERNAEDISFTRAQETELPRALK